MSVDRVLAAAKSQAKAGDVAGAHAALSALATRFPRNARVKKAIAALDTAARPKSLKGPIAALAKLHQAGHRTEVIAKGVPLLANAPDDALLHRIIADALLKEGRALDGAKVLAKILARRPGDVELTLTLGSCLKAIGRHGRVVSLLTPLAEKHPHDAKILNNLGNALRALNRHQDARRYLERAVEADPSEANAHNNLGVVYAECGDIARAHEAYERGIALDPTLVDLHANRAAIHKFAPGDPAITAMEHLLAGDRLETEDRCALNFALGRAYDQLREEATAFSHFEEGNRLRRLMLPFSVGDTRASIQAILTHSAHLPKMPTPDGPRPIFVVGLPRSGTSLVEQILAAHPMVEGLGEIDHLRAAVDTAWDKAAPPSEACLAAIAEAYTKGLGALSSAPVVTDKAPLNFRWIGLIAAALPHASIVHVHRKPEAVCWSIYSLRFTTGGHPYGDDLHDVGTMARLYEAMMGAWERVHPGRVIHLSYETLTEDPDAEIPRLLAACDLPFHEACLSPETSGRAVMTASAGQVRRAIYGGSSEKWRRYDRFLAPLHQALATPISLDVPPAPTLADAPVAEHTVSHP